MEKLKRKKLEEQKNGEINKNREKMGNI